MRRRLLRTGRADRDLHEATAYLLQEAGEAVALRFLDSVEETFALLEEQPEIGRVYVPDNPRLSEMRAWHVHRFDRYLVFYRILDDEDALRVERVLHGSRDLWKVLGLED